MIYYLLFVFLIPLFIAYFLICFVVPPLFFNEKEIKIEDALDEDENEKEKEKEKEKEEEEEEEEPKDRKVFITKDYIHSDFIFYSSEWSSIFITEKKYIVIGWGDRGIFLETKTWPELKTSNVIKAFFGLNESVVRVKFIDRLPEDYVKNKINIDQFESLKNHIMSSFLDFQEIKKEDDYCEDGIFYKSKLNYNCINTCNNWVNQGLLKSNITKRTWAPLSINIKIID